MYARLIDNVVVETYTPPEGFALEHCFTREVAAMFVACPDGTVIGTTYTDGRWTAPTPPTP